MLDDITMNCSRCGELCKLAHTATKDARLLKHAIRPETRGFCPDCAVTDFFKNQSQLAMLLEMNPTGKAMLLDARIQQQFASILQTGNADAKPEEINWQRIYENWELPSPKAAKRRKK